MTQLLITYADNIVLGIFTLQLLIAAGALYISDY